MSNLSEFSERFGCFTLFLCLLGGGLLGCTFSSIRLKGYFIKWQKLTDAPADFMEFEASREWSLYVTTSNGKIFWYSDHWEEIEEVPSYINDHWDVIKPCNREAPQFSFVTNVPNNIVDCIQDEGVDTEFYSKHVYALDQDGVIWEWHLLNSGYAVVLDSLILAFIFGMIGLIVGVILVKLRKRNKLSNQITGHST